MEDGIVIDDAVGFVELTVSNSEDCLRRFISTYESLPELWNRNDSNYMNKWKKRKSLEKLLAIYREIKPHAVIKDVTKKLNTLRSNFRRELNKIKSSLSDGCERESAYKPCSWVFYALSFLAEDSEGMAPLINQNDKPEESQGQEENNSTYLQPTTSSLSSNTSGQPPVKKKKFNGPIAKYKELPLTLDFLPNKGSQLQDNEYLNLAKVWASKLKNLHPIQRKLAEKKINDIFFEAEIETLRRDSGEINISRNPTSTISSPSTSTLSSQSPVLSDISLLPLLQEFRDDPRRHVYDQHFGGGLMNNEILHPTTPFLLNPLRSGYSKPGRNSTVGDSGVSSVQADKNGLLISLDVQQFKPEEIKISVADGYIVIDGKHEEPPDDHGYASRQFTRRYKIPDNINEVAIASNLSSDGVLTLKAPPKALPDLKSREIPITHVIKPVVKEDQQDGGDMSTVLTPITMRNGTEQ
ncbi:uncharacterized protein [Halyomorpha halys]|uniref:uncharacterized protein n=1 Tax=Halyomorpha halys TaxID=286706 RepID=UPI0006D50DD8|nr:uncharacterized protein LOC106693000 [Halyomorpha halys]